MFLAKHATVLVTVLAAAWGAGALALGSRETLALRTALGFAIWGEVLFLLGAAQSLRIEVVAVLLIVTIIGGALRVRPTFKISWMLALAVPAFLLALHPPQAFDETLYHLSFVRAYAEAGGLRFLPELRYPAFPVLHEMLCVPVYRVAGDVATHLVSIAETIVTAMLVGEWARRYDAKAAPVAAALFIGSPIVIHQATILYVEPALTLFVVGGFYALDVALTESRRLPLVLSGLFFGAACSVKYLGGFFAVSALIIVLVMHKRHALLFALATALAALPATVWLMLTTGNPVFPFFGRSDWALPPDPPRAHPLLDALLVPWNATFARERLNSQPPMTPLLIALLLLVAAAAWRNWRARAVLLMTVTYLAAFAFLPQDTRYLLPLLPLLCVCASAIIAMRVPRAATAATLIAILPAIVYLAYRLSVMGIPAADARPRIAGYEALMRAGDARVYTCGGEQLQYYAGGKLLGDWNGPHSYARVLDDAAMDARMRERGVEYFLVVKHRCGTPANKTMTLVYEDAGAQLWRLESPPI